MKSSQLNPPSEDYTKFPASSDYLSTKYTDRENRMDSFTKAFTDTISKARMSEREMRQDKDVGEKEPGPLLSPKHRLQCYPCSALNTGYLVLQRLSPVSVER